MAAGTVEYHMSVTHGRPRAPGSAAIALTLVVLIAAGALALRVPDLGNRPMHGDEAVHAVKFAELWKTGRYRYDPTEYHGPTIYYAALPSVWLHGRKSFADTTAADYRVVTAVFGAATVLLMALLLDAIGRRAAVWAALLTAISPAFVFYSRYYIQEVLLAFFTLAVVASAWRYVRDRKPAWAIGAGICAGLMLATKETAILAFAAMLLSAWLARLSLRRSAAEPAQPWDVRLLATALAVGVLVSALLLSGFRLQASAPLDLLRSAAPWLQRAGSTELHREPWYYYLKLLAWNRAAGEPVYSEALILGLAAVGLVSVFVGDRIRGAGFDPAFARFVGLYTLILAAAYSVIPYKTPWCVLSFLCGFILLAGIGASVLMGLVRAWAWPVVVAALLLLGCAQLGAQAYRASFTAYTAAGNPWVYAQPVVDVESLASRVTAIAKASPQGDATVVKVFSVDPYYWPLPWYLRRLPNVGYWVGVPRDANAPIVLASPELDDAVSKRLNDTHLMNGIFGLRPGAFFELWVRMDLWKRYLATRKHTDDD